MATIHPKALFRLMVLGPLASRHELQKGELTRLIQAIASKTYDIPGSKNVHISAASIERWYHLWKKGGIEALAPKVRRDQGQSQLEPKLQDTILTAKREQPSRSINSIIRLLELKKIIGKKTLSRSSVHRLLKQHQLSARVIGSPDGIERRRFVAQHAGDIWQGDVMHGPSLLINGKYQKTYLISFIDDASRLITHSEFRLGETALDIQVALRQAILKRGLPKRIILDNGSGYRCGSLQAICARLSIQLVFCRPYEPAGKGKIERWHSTIRSQFLSELALTLIENLADLNGRLWAYLEQIYHVNPHSGLEGTMSPRMRWRQDILQIKQLGVLVSQLDEIFYHREKRRVRKDGCVSLKNRLYEVPYTLSGQNVMMVFDPESNDVKWVESKEGEKLGDAVLLDPIHNLHRKRQRPIELTDVKAEDKKLGSIVELNYDQYQEALSIYIDTDNQED